MLGLWSIGSSPVRLESHIAFSVGLDDLIASIAKLRGFGITPRRRGGGPELDEPCVFPWMPAASVYFDDPDGHSLEYISVLAGPAHPEITGVLTLSEWRRTVARTDAIVT